MAEILPIILVVAIVAGLLFLAFFRFGKREERMRERLEQLKESTRPIRPAQSLAELTRNALPKIGTPLLPSSEEERTQLRTRLLHAGLYNPNALAIFLGVKMCLIVLPVMLGVIAIAGGVMSPVKGMILVALGSLFGMLGPGFWLGSRKTQRQTALRRALPDALDIIMICLEGGVSLPGAFQRVVGMLRLAHPLLAQEMNIVQRHIQMGRSTGEALREFADRADLEEVRVLASVVLQSEKFGASLVKALRTHSESLRLKRLMLAEELAQKASVKVLFPMLLCIFPAVFIVLIGPAMIQIKEVFAQMNW